MCPVRWKSAGFEYDMRCIADFYSPDHNFGFLSAITGIHISTSYSRSRLFWLLTHTLKKEKKNVPLTLLPSNMMTTSLWAYSWISVSHAWNSRSRHSNKLTASPAKTGRKCDYIWLSPKILFVQQFPRPSCRTSFFPRPGMSPRLTLMLSNEDLLVMS